MLFHHTTLLSMAALGCLALTTPLSETSNTQVAATSNGMNPMQPFSSEQTSTTSSSYSNGMIHSDMLTSALSEYYENIVDQVVVTLIEDITSSAPYSYMSIYHISPMKRGKKHKDMCEHCAHKEIILLFIPIRCRPCSCPSFCACFARSSEPDARQPASVDSPARRV